jgi:hypothetical protein
VRVNHLHFANVKTYLLATLRRVSNDGRTDGTRNAVVVRLAHAANHTDSGLAEVMLSQVADTLLSEHEVRLHGNDRPTNERGN